MSRRDYGGGYGNGAGNLTKKVKQGPVELDLEDSALVVHYETETVELDDRGAVLAVIERKPEVRRIKIKSLSPDKNMAQLAADIVEKCKYIHPSRAEEIEQLLIKLRKHFLANNSSSNSSNYNNINNNRSGVAASSGSDRHGERERERESEREKPPAKRSESRGRASSSRRDRDENDRERERERDRDRDTEREREREPERRVKKKSPPVVDSLPPADMSALDDYLEMLYQVSGKSEREREEGLRMQERGTAMILKLCRDVMNLEQLIQNSTVMGAVTRVLQEEYKKSVELTFNILRIFLAFSNFTEMHSLMANYRIGVLTMKAIEFEVKRSELREAENAQREKAWADELSAAKESSPAEYTALLEKTRKHREREHAKQAQFARKQDKLLFVGFYVLLNLAEDVSVEKKMIKKALIPQLIAMLSPARGAALEDLLILAVTFLKKLSVFEENKNVFRELNLVESLSRFVPCSSQPLVNISLRLLFNLSFDKDLREKMLKAGFVPKLTGLLRTPAYRAKTLKLLYHLSVDDRCKAMLTYTDGVPLLMGMTINFPHDLLAKELAALVLNISFHPRNCELMIANKGLNLLVDRFADKRDPLLMKIIRNISLWSFNMQQSMENPETQYKHRGLWSPHIKVLLEALLEESNHDLIIEIVGCLANMTIYDLPSTSTWAKLVRDFNLVSFVSKMLVPGLAQNDLVLEIVMLLATIATDQQACNVLAAGSLISTLYQLFKEKSEDVEILLQLLNCFHKLLFTESSRETVMYSTRVFSDIIECLTHRNSAVRAKAEQMSELVLEFDRRADGTMGALGQQVLKKRFESYNRVWLAQVMDASSAQGYPDHDRLMSSYEQEASMINHANYFSGKVDNSMSEWQMNSKLDDSELDLHRSEVDSWSYK